MVKKILSILLITSSLFVTPVFAGTWTPHEAYYDKTTDQTLIGGWEYILDDGTCASGWQYIDGSWYYLDPNDGCARTGYLEINNKPYYFDETSCKMTSNQWVRFFNGRIEIECWATNSGELDFTTCRIPYYQ